LYPIKYDFFDGNLQPIQNITVVNRGIVEKYMNAHFGVCILPQECKGKCDAALKDALEACVDGFEYKPSNETADECKSKIQLAEQACNAATDQFVKEKCYDPIALGLIQLLPATPDDSQYTLPDSVRFKLRITQHPNDPAKLTPLTFPRLDAERIIDTIKTKVGVTTYISNIEEGSVILEMAAVNVTVSSSNYTALQNYLKSELKNDVGLNIALVQIEEGPSATLAGWAVALIVLGSIALAVLVVAPLFYFRRRKALAEDQYELLP